MSPSLAPSLDATPTSASRRLPASSRRWQSGQRRGACNDFAWTDVGVESSAFHDGGPIEEAPCISSRRPSCKQSGRVQGNKGTFFLSPSLCNQGLCFRVLQEGAPSS